MAGCGWSWVAGLKLWLVVGSHGCWQQSYSWQWAFAQFCNASFFKNMQNVVRRWNLLKSGNVIFTIDIVFSESECLFHMVNSISLISHGQQQVFVFPNLQLLPIALGPEFVFPGANPNLFPTISNVLPPPQICVFSPSP